jgi:hypothetical protein
MRSGKRNTPIAVAVVAFVLAMVGVAPAARDLITSPEIKNKSIKTNDLSEKLRGSEGPPGGRGPPGEQGPPGERGAHP